MYRILLLICVVVTSFPIQAGELDNVLNGVAWRGPGATMSDLRGKTVIIMSYVTWCPKCNVWSPDLFEQVREAATDKPVVVVAVCTDEETVPGTVYVSQRKLLGPNILHAYHPTMDRLMGTNNASLFSYVMIGPEGNVIDRGSAGSYYPNGSEKEYSVARKINGNAAKGQFTILDPEMPADVKQLLWPMELGQLLSSRDLNRAKSKLSRDGRVALESGVEGFVDSQLAQIHELKEQDIPAQIMASQKAEMLAKAFPATDAGKEARELWIGWTKDQDFKKELAALSAFEKVGTLVSKAPATRKPGILNGFISRFEGTHAATLAAQRLEQEQKERVSPEE